MAARAVLNNAYERSISCPTSATPWARQHRSCLEYWQGRNQLQAEAQSPNRSARRFSLLVVRAEAKEIRFDQKSRAALQAGIGIDKLVEAVGVSLGPRDGEAAAHALKIRMTPLMCRVQGMQPFRQIQSTRLMRASYAGTEGAQSSEKPAWQHTIKSLSESSLGTAFRNFPWERVYVRFVQRVLDMVWIIVKWLAIPVLALSTLSELLYTLTAKKDIFIPLGILTGILLAKVIGNASLDVAKELQDGRTSWPLMAMGMFFVLLKLPGPYYPSGAAAFLPHVANAGLVQTAFLFRESQQMSV